MLTISIGKTQLLVAEIESPKGPHDDSPAQEAGEAKLVNIKVDDCNRKFRTNYFQGTIDWEFQMS